MSAAPPDTVPARNRHRAFAEALTRRLDPSYRQRWEIFDGIVQRLAGPETRWLDGGCGRNIAVAEFPCGLNAGLDVYRHPELCRDSGVEFVMGDLERLPYRDGAFTLVTLSTVAEHFRNPDRIFSEIRRVLAPGGRLLIHTTNLHSPLVFLGKLIPDRIRRRLFTRTLGAQEEDIFPAFHRANTPRVLRSIPGFTIEEFHAVQDLNWTSRPVFLCLLAWHLFSRLPGLWRLRTNMVVLLRKNETVRNE